MANQDPTRRRRAPNGLNSAKPIYLRFTPEERARAESIASKEKRTLAAVCRLACLRGFDEYDRDPRALVTTPQA